MYFFTKQGTVCHILDDNEAGKAPAPCGAKLTRLELMRFHAGIPTSKVTDEKPINIPMCKHCQKAGVEMNI
jgi:hypothetical protein